MENDNEEQMNECSPNLSNQDAFYMLSKEIWNLSYKLKEEKKEYMEDILGLHKLISKLYDKIYEKYENKISILQDLAENKIDCLHTDETMKKSEKYLEELNIKWNNLGE